MANKDFNLNSFCLDDYLDFVDKGSKKKKKKKDKKDKKGKKKNKETKKYSKEHDLFIKSLYAPENLSSLVDIQKCPKEMLKEVSIAKQVIEASQANINEYVHTVFKAASEVIMDEYIGGCLVVGDDIACATLGGLWLFSTVSSSWLPRTIITALDIASKTCLTC